MSQLCSPPAPPVRNPNPLAKPAVRNPLATVAHRFDSAEWSPERSSRLAHTNQPVNSRKDGGMRI